MENIIRKLYEKNNIEYKELLYLLKNLDEYYKNRLFYYAKRTTLETYGNNVFLRGLLEFSNYCENNCLYCGLRMDNENIERYRLNLKEIIQSFFKASKLGYKTLVLQSGEDEYFTDQRLIKLIKKIKDEFQDIALTLSLGERSYESYKKLYKAGADRYLLRHETANKERYNNLHPGQNFFKREKCLNNLKEIGYQTGAGFIIGLPGQTLEDIAHNLLFLKKHELDMVGLGPLITHPDTPLAGKENGSVELTLISYALVRLLLPETLIPATTALNTLDKRGWEKSLKAGANVIMPNLSSAANRGKYEIYQNKGDTDVSELNKIKERVKKVGFEVSMARGDSIKWLKKNNFRRSNND